MDELKEKFREYLSKNNRVYVKQVMTDLGLEEYQVYGLVDLIKGDGSLFEVKNKRIVKSKPERKEGIYRIPNSSEHIKLCLLSDTHLASKFDRLDLVQYVYDEADRRRVDYILHDGDFFDGLGAHTEQLKYLKEATYDGQKEYGIDKYPVSPIPTLLVGGNHDYRWIKRCGRDILTDLAKEREDLIYLGGDTANIEIGKLKIRMYHGTKGKSHLGRERVLKYLSTIPEDERPDILQLGHIHQDGFAKDDRTYCFQTSCLQDLTSFENYQGLTSNKSVWWVDAIMNEQGVVKISHELERFEGNKVKIYTK